MYSFTNRLRISSLFGVATAIQGNALVAGSLVMAGLGGAEQCFAEIENGGFERQDSNGNPDFFPWAPQFAEIIVDPDNAENHIACIDGGGGMLGAISQAFDCREEGDGTWCQVNFRYRTEGDFEGEATMFAWHATEGGQLDLEQSVDWRPASVSLNSCEDSTLIHVLVTSGTIYVDDFSSHCVPTPGCLGALAGGLMLNACRRRSGSR